MSTDHQECSIEIQSTAIALYAASHNMGIVRSYVDSGKSGLTIARREGLQELIRTVTRPQADFEVILVYDVSRWGRFQDVDESAHYEFLCRRSGIQVRYCAEKFENDGTPTSNILKALKRMMAGEYSRELSAKVFAAQCRLASLGYWSTGIPPYGTRRQTISKDGLRKQILQPGEQKNIRTDRVILVPGPPQELSDVRYIFDAFTKRKKRFWEIRNGLNRQGRSFRGTPSSSVYAIMSCNMLARPFKSGLD
jgi:DNA invertase Pin-like site-specific DNA recombinase